MVVERERKQFHKDDKRGFATLLIAGMWALWKQHNAWVFNNLEQQRTPDQLVIQILQDIVNWWTAGLGGVGGLDCFM